jgi:hypothetical protein
MSDKNWHFSWKHYFSAYVDCSSLGQNWQLLAEIF